MSIAFTCWTVERVSNVPLIITKTIQKREALLPIFLWVFINLTAPPAAENVESDRGKHLIYGFWSLSTPGELGPYGLLSKFRSPPRQQES
jgi:hypothetical protein